MSQKIVALMPLKANSERVKGKNFKLLGGKPLFQWMLDSMLQVDEISKIIINTDARDLLVENGLKQNDKIEIRDRKAELCGDFVSMNLILEDDIAAVDADLYLMTHTTNPFVSPETIRRSIAKLKDSDADSLFSVNKVQTRFYDKDVQAINHDPDNLVRTQDLPAWFEENSCLYLFTRQSFETTNARIGSKPVMFEMPKLEAVDIDEPEDWQLAQALAPYFAKRDV